MGALDGLDAAEGVDADADVGAFGFEHPEDLAGALVAEELAMLAFVPGDAVAFDKLEELGGRVSRERGLGKVGAAVGDVVGGGGTKVGEIAAAAARDEDLVSKPRLVFKDGHGPAVEAGDTGAEESGGAAAEDDDIEFVSHVWRSVSPGAARGTREQAHPGEGPKRPLLPVAMSSSPGEGFLGRRRARRLPVPVRVWLESGV